MRIFTCTVLCLFLISCDQLQQIGKSAGGAFNTPTKEEITAGIREALVVGTKNTVLQTAQENGFYGNNLIKIPFPPEAANVEKKVRDMGLGKQADKFIETLNRGAEEASARATPIFVDAIKEMSMQDVYDIWRGKNDAATQYLRKTTHEKLSNEFRPVIKQALDKVEITKYWNPIVTTYNSIPMVQDVNPDLDEYVLERTLDGLFLVLANEEAKIREDPAARVTDLLKKVFGYRGPAPQELN